MWLGLRRDDNQGAGGAPLALAKGRALSPALRAFSNTARAPLHNEKVIEKHRQDMGGITSSRAIEALWGESSVRARTPVAGA